MKYKVHYPYITFYIHNTISIDDFFHQFHLSKKTIHLYKQNKSYTVNNHFVSSSTILIKGDQFTIKAFEEDNGMYPACYEDIDIIYEDEFILVVNKPAFIQVYPDHPSKTDSLANRVSAYYQQKGYNIPVKYIHRLDYETSGLILFCKCALVQPLLDYQLSIKTIHRQYLAIVNKPILDFKEHTIHKNIARDRHHQQRMRVAFKGKEAITTYQCLASKNNLSLIQCTLHTGRKHQIRVHMASIGYPLLGDHLYHQKSTLINRQALHAYRLKFIHPITNEKITLKCYPPHDMLKLIHLIDPDF